MEDESDEGKGLERFHRLENAADFFLHEAFHHACGLARGVLAGAIYGERIMAIDPPEGWTVPPAPQGLPGFVETRDQIVVLPEETLDALSRAWRDAQEEAESTSLRISRKRVTEDVEVLGYVINLAAAVECLVNRRLFMAMEKKEIDGGTYNMLERGEVVAKLLFLFKEVSTTAVAEISALRRVFTLRNEAVHMKAKANPVRLSFEELLRQLRAVSWLCDRVEGDPKGTAIDAFAAEYALRWLE